MQSVSQAWKDNQNNTLVSESDIEISLKMTDPDAYNDASASDNGHPYWSNTNYIVTDGDKIISPYATLETNQWLLDGSRVIVPNSGSGDTGYIGSLLCDINGAYSTNPIVTVDFTQVHTNLLQGVTIKWSEFLNEYAVEFIVTAYNGETVVAEKTVTDNTSVQSVVMFDISDYDKITVEVVKWSIAYRRARIDEIFIGVNKVFSKKDIFSYDCSHSVDPISAELPKSEVSFSIDNLNEEYNPYNAEGLSKYLIERQEINVRYGYKLANGIEWISGGKYYMSEWNAKQNGMSADFKARDLLEFMTGTYYKGLYNPAGTSLYDLAVDVLEDANLPLNSDGSVKWVIDERLKDIYTVTPLPIDTHANCLQMIANAGESVFYQDREGMLKIESRCNSSSDMLTLGEYTGIKWGYRITDAEIINLFNTFVPGVYELSFTSTITAIYDTFQENDWSRVLFQYSDQSHGADLKLHWGADTTVGSTATVTGQFEITDDDLKLGLWRISLYGLGRTNVQSGLATISDIKVHLISSDYAITHFNSYSKSGLSLSKPLKQVDVPCYSYSIAEQSSELYKGTMNITDTTDIVITYSGTATNVSANVTGGTLNSATYYSNACVLNITGEGDVEITITGYSLESSSVTITTHSGVSGETVTVDNMLITSQDRAVAIGSWVETYMRNRMTLSSDWRADPRLDALDMVDNENDYGTNKVLMTEVKYSYNGAFKGSGEGRVI